MTDQAVDAGACEAMGATTVEHTRLDPFAGTFKAEVKMWMGPGEPMVSTGVMKNTWDLDGRFLHQSYRGDATEGPFPNFEGRGYWGYNKLANKYEGFWIDTVSPMMQTESGDLDGSGAIGFGDLTSLLNAWGPTCPDEHWVPCPADLNFDRSIGFADLTIMLNSWGACAPAPDPMH